MVLLLLALKLLAFAPEAHAWLHRSDHATPDETCHADSSAPRHLEQDCAITLFAQGLTTSFAISFAPAPRAIVSASPVELKLTNASHQLPASQAPPSGA